MPIISAQDWQKEQQLNNGYAPVPQSSGVIKAEDFLKSQPASTTTTPKPTVKITPQNQALIDKSQASLKRLQAEQAANPPPAEPGALLKGLAFIQSLIPFNQQLNKAVTSEGVAKVLAPVQSAVQNNVIPKVDVNKAGVPNVPLPLVGSTNDFINSIANLPGDAQRSAIQTGKNLEAIGQGVDVPTTKVVADLMPAATFVLSIATLGKGKAALEGTQAALSGGKSVLSKAGSMLLNNAKNLAPVGAGFGLTGGLQANAGAPNVPAQVVGALPSVAAGAVAATGLGMAGELGGVGVNAGMRTLLPKAELPANAALSALDNSLSQGINQATAEQATQTAGRTLPSGMAERPLLPAAGQTTRTLPPTEYPAGVQTSPGGGVMVPPGGFQAYGTGPTNALRSPIDSFTTDAGPNGIALNLVESILGKKGTQDLQAKFISETAPNPYPAPETVPLKPTETRPVPVTGAFKKEVIPAVEQQTNLVNKDIQTHNLEVKTPDTVFADQILNKMEKPAEAAAPYIAQEHIPGEQFGATPSDSNARAFTSSIFESTKERVRSLGPSGSRLSAGLDRQQALSRNVYGETSDLRAQITKLSKQVLKTPEDEMAFYKARTDGSADINPKFKDLNDLVTTLQAQMLQKENQVGVLVHDVTGQSIGDPTTHVYHTLNDAGRKAQQTQPNRFFERIASSSGKSVEEVKALLTGLYNQNGDLAEPVAGFEKKLGLNIPADWLETNPARWNDMYAHSASDRISGAEVFGKDYKAASDLITQIAQETGNPQQAAYNLKLAKDLVLQSVGKNTANVEANGFLNNMMQNAVRAKLSVITATGNVSQGFNALSDSFGFPSAFNGIYNAFTKEGRSWAKEIGFEFNGKGGFYSQATGQASKVQDLIWKATSGFPLTEDYNFVVGANGSKAAFESLARKLVKDPTNTMLRNKLEMWGISADQVIKEGGIPLKELKMASANYVNKSIFPKVAGSMPEWSQGNIVGKMTYLFNHYTFNQARFVAENFKLGKVQGLTALARMTLAASITGEIPADLNSLISGNARPDNIFARLIDNSITAVAPLPYSILKDMTSLGGGLLGATGGPIASGLTKTGGNVVNKAASGDIRGAIGQGARGYLRGDLPMVPTIPQGSLIDRYLFPSASSSRNTSNKPVPFQPPSQ